MAGALSLQNGLDGKQNTLDELMENGGNLFAPDNDTEMETPNISSKVA